MDILLYLLMAVIGSFAIAVSLTVLLLPPALLVFIIAAIFTTPTYIVKNAFPLFKTIALWAARLENLISMFILNVLCFLAILFFIFLLNASIDLITIISVLLLVIAIGTLHFISFWTVFLGVAVWLIRLSILAFAAWKIWLLSIYSAAFKETAEVKNNISGYTRQARHKISGGNKEEGMDWKTRLLMKIMANKLVIKFLSIPIVMKVLMKMAGVVFWVISKFKKQEAAD